MEIVDTGAVNCGEAGTRRAMCTFPTVAALSNGTLLATYRVGSAKDSDDGTTELRRSSDGGKTWGEPRQCFETTVDGTRGSLAVCYLTELSAGHVIAAALWMDREAYPGRPLFNPETEGCLPMTVLLADSEDCGETWTPWRSVPMPPEIGPPSLTNPILKLSDGTLALSIETNKAYDDASKWYQRAVLFRSHDLGQTWEGPVTAAEDPTGRIFNWDQRAGVSPDGRIGTFLWTYDSETKEYLNIHRRISADGGRTWSEPDDLGFPDQAARPAILPDGRTVLAWVDRFQTHSIRARVAADIAAPFEAETEVVLYTLGQAEGEAAGVQTTSELLAEMSLWTFGLPYAEALPDGDVIVVYYAGTDAAMDIRWARLRLS